MGSLLTVSSDVWLWKSPLIPQASVSFAMRAQGTSRLESGCPWAATTVSGPPGVFTSHLGLRSPGYEPSLVWGLAGLLCARRGPAGLNFSPSADGDQASGDTFPSHNMISPRPRPSQAGRELSPHFMAVALVAWGSAWQPALGLVPLVHWACGLALGVWRTGLGVACAPLKWSVLVSACPEDEGHHLSRGRRAAMGA